MASVLKWNDFNLNKKAKKQDFSTSLFTEALTVVCNIHKKYPNRPLQHPLAKYLLDQSCRSIGIPISEPAGVFGGACYVPYRLTGTCLDLNRPSTGKPCKTPAVWVFPITIPGAIIDVVYTQAVNQDITMTVSFKTSPTAQVNQISSTIGWLKGKFAGTSAQMRWGLACNEADDVRNVTQIGGFNATRIDGLPDDCGNAKPDYPNNPSPSPSDYQGTFEVTNIDNSDNVVSNRRFNYDFYSPELGFPINFNISGHEFNFNFEGLNTGTDKDNFDGSEPPSSNGGDNDKDFIPEDYDEIEEGQEEEQIEVEKPDIEYVVVIVTQDPDKRRVMTFNDPELRHMYAGYFCWTIQTNTDNTHMPYTTITKEKNIYRRPQGATGFRAYTINGAKIRTKIYQQKQ